MNLPVGSIILWGSGTVPDGWQVCDGTNGTPNLVDKFPLGASVDGDLLVTGGSTTHLHGNGNTGDRAAHSHTGLGGTSGNAEESNIYGGTSSGVADGHSHSLSSTIASDNLHNHTIGNTNSPTDASLPPYKKFLYIMRMT